MLSSLPPSVRRLMPAGIMLSIIVIVGTLGYMAVEGWELLESLYMVIITLFTIGFHEVHPLSQAGRLFTICIAVTGVGTAVYAGGQIMEIIVEGEILGYRRKRKMQQKIKDMKNHYIICGLGRTGHQVAEEFCAARVPFVVIDRKPETAEELELRGIPYIIGDVISDDNLEAAGIRTAKGLVCTADSDVANSSICDPFRACPQS